MIFVTGGTGLLGSHLLLELCKEGAKVRALKRTTSSLKQIEHIFNVYNSKHLLNNIEWVGGDITDIHSITDALQGVTHVYHCASVVSFKPEDEANMLKINIEGAANIVNACLDAGIEKLCYVSSVAALNNSIPGQLITENIFWKSSPQNSSYSISKYSGEREAWRGMEEGLKVIIVNPTVILGASVLNTGSSEMIYRAKKGNKFYTSGQTGFVDATDVAKIMVSLMKGNASNERFILTSENMSYREFYSIANKHFGKKPPAIYCGKLITEVGWRLLKILSVFGNSSPRITKDIARAAHNKKQFSNKKISSLLNFSFLPVKTSIENACQHYRDQH